MRVALSFDLAHEPGTHFAVSRIDAQLLGVVLERASGERFARYIGHAIWNPIGAGAAEWRVDRPGGMAAVFDGLHAAPGDLLRLGAFLAGEGGEVGGGLLPKGWVRGLATDLGDGGFLLAADGRAVWVWPREQLVIVRLGPGLPAGQAGSLPRILRAGLH
jgi:CubicO group peptidase (beta-lactamase class C family)